jgi:hypothetical protein
MTKSAFHTPSRENERTELSARDARQGEIVLRKPWQRIVFFGGLIGMVALVLVGAFLAAA